MHAECLLPLLPHTENPEVYHPTAYVGEMSRIITWPIMRGYKYSASLSNEIPLLIARDWAMRGVEHEDLRHALVTVLGRRGEEEDAEDHEDHELHGRLVDELLTDVTPCTFRLCPQCMHNWI